MYKNKANKYKVKLNALKKNIFGGSYDENELSDYKIKFFIQSLKKEDRMKNIEKNKLIIPEIEIFESINGYNKDITTKYLLDMKIKYNKLDFETYGTLANFLTKVKAFQYQIKNKIKYMCLIEDDLVIKEDFKKFIENNLHLLKNHNMLRLSDWGEGYVTSLNGAIKIVEHIYKLGIISNIDNQLRNNCGREKKLDNTPWELVVETNKGDCLKTEKISENEKIQLQKKTII